MKTHPIQKPRLTQFATALLALALLARIAPLAANAAPLGTAFTYQGLLTEGGNPATGLYDLRFNIYITEMGGSAVSHLPNLVPPGLVRSAVPVTNGLFTTLIDFGDVYDGTAYWLEIEAHPSGSASEFQLLTPRQELTLSPYAIFATTAGGLAGNAVTSGSIAPGTVVRSLNGLSDAVTLSAGANVSIMPSGNTLTIASTGSGGGIWALDGASAYYNGGRVGIGTSIPQSALHISGVPDAVRLTGSHPFLTLDDTAAGLYSRIEANGAGMTFKTQGAVSGSNPSGLLHLDGVGYVGIGTTTPSAKLQVVSTDAGIDAVYGTSTGSGVGVSGRSPGGKGVYGVSFSAAATSAGLWGENPIPGGTAVVGKSLSPQTGTGGTGVYGESASPTGVGVYGANTGGGEAGHFQGKVTVNGTLTAAALTITGDSTVAGHSTVCALTITGGCDLSEPFRMSTGEIPQGSVVVIDDETAGQLKRSERAYDTRVAGIVSGANGIKPGISLSQQGVNDGGQNVALSGRVYVLADASSGPIKPGDLLTTSSIAGHAMKVTDHTKAQGAILGKAMSGLKDCKGMVLVLVTLQ